MLTADWWTDAAVVHVSLSSVSPVIPPVCSSPDVCGFTKRWSGAEDASVVLGRSPTVPSSTRSSLRRTQSSAAITAHLRRAARLSAAATRPVNPGKQTDNGNNVSRRAAGEQNAVVWFLSSRFSSTFCSLGRKLVNLHQMVFCSQWSGRCFSSVWTCLRGRRFIFPDWRDRAAKPGKPQRSI